MKSLLASLIALASLAAPAWADVAYTWAPCGPGYGACDVTTPNDYMASASQTQAISTALSNFLVSSHLGFDPAASFSWSVTNENANGVIIGQVSQLRTEIDAQFIYSGGQVHCCTADSPYLLAGINDSNLVIGQDAYGYAFLTELSLGNSNYLPSETFEIPGAPYDLAQGHFDPLAINDQGQILASDLGAEYILTPGFEPTPTPEPGTFALFSLAIAGAFWSIRKRAGFQN